jgi:hypothetical protein
VLLKCENFKSIGLIPIVCLQDRLKDRTEFELKIGAILELNQMEIRER